MKDFRQNLRKLKPQVRKKRVEKVPCESCVKKFIKVHKRKPNSGELIFIQKVNPDCLCESCYTEYQYEKAGMKVPRKTSTFQGEYWDLGFK